MSTWSEIFPAGFDSAAQPETYDYSPLPAGWYTVMVEDAAVVDTRTPGGKRLKTMFSVVSGQHSGRKIFQSFNIKNANQKAVEIGLRELGAFTKSCGLVCVRDSAEFLGKILDVRVAVRADPGREPDNVVKGFRPAGNTGVVVQIAPAPSPAPVATKPPVPFPDAAPSPAAEMPLPWDV